MTDGMHSLMHNLQVSRCRTPWAELRWNDSGARICSQCSSEIFQICGLSEEEVEDRIRSAINNYRSNRKLRLRSDGTMILEKTECCGQIRQALETGLWQQIAGAVISVGTIPVMCFIVGCVSTLFALVFRQRDMLVTAVFGMMIPSVVVMIGWVAVLWVIKLLMSLVA